jgi:AAA+ ATPase superfamily predicted ATPase
MYAQSIVLQIDIIMPFHDRLRELQLLDELFARAGGQLFVLYGRRRVGKTVLMTHWLEKNEHRALFWTADRTSAVNQLRGFSQAIQAFITPEQAIPMEFSYSTWEIALNEVARLAQEERIVVVLDEFTYLIESDSTLPSILQRLWDHRLKQANVLLVLTGSHAGMIEREVLAYRSPLYNRATQSLHLQPLPFGTLSLFFPGYSAAERVTLYGCIGGVPQYLELLEPDRTVDENLRGLLSSSMILDDAGALLRDQLSEPRNYVAIVESIAAGFTRLTEIATMAGLPHSSVGKYLSVLQHLGIVERIVPATVHRPDESKQGRYRIVDHYLRFYYRFLAPARTNLERGLSAQVWANMRQHLAEFIGTYTFEELCQEWVLMQADAGHLPFIPRRVGAAWGRKTFQVDVVAVNDDEHAILLGECKWTAGALGRSVVRSLIDKTAAVLPEGVEGWKVTYAFFSKEGFTAEAKKEVANIPTFWIDLPTLDQGLHTR